MTVKLHKRYTIKYSCSVCSAFYFLHLCKDEYPIFCLKDTLQCGHHSVTLLYMGLFVYQHGVTKGIDDKHPASKKARKKFSKLVLDRQRIRKKQMTQGI